MLALLLVAAGGALRVMTPIGAVSLTPIAAPADMQELPAPVESAQNLPEIVHLRVQPQGTRPPQGTRATTLSSNASTRGDPGLGVL
jgi:hypothetical protein